MWRFDRKQATVVVFQHTVLPLGGTKSHAGPRRVEQKKGFRFSCIHGQLRLLFVPKFYDRLGWGGVVQVTHLETFHDFSSVSTFDRIRRSPLTKSSLSKRIFPQWAKLFFYIYIVSCVFIPSVNLKITRGILHFVCVSLCVCSTRDKREFNETLSPRGASCLCAFPYDQTSSSEQRSVCFLNSTDTARAHMFFVCWFEP